MPFLLLLFLAIPSVALAHIYRFVDEKGSVIYTDQPQPNAQVILLSPTQVYSAQPLQEVLPTPAEPTQAALTNVTYTDLAILIPESQQMIHTADLTVKVQITPELSADNKLILFLDNKPVGKPQVNQRFYVKNIERGEHVLSVAVVDEFESVVKRSAEVVFYRFQASKPKMAPQDGLEPPTR